ncbi:unnamed protein product [Toxocara canis]|uniref:ANK_REP_REGION domain-containing protein n=1 Tax=Toxocara canis TaxID=6265 RepID=A0A183V0K9_TOXCA|nr:unnamed protein product [Toxocara canis]
MSGNTSAAEILLERGAQINHIDKDKHSPVHWAVVCGQFDTLALLLRKGANVNASDNQVVVSVWQKPPLSLRYTKSAFQGAQPLHYATISEDIPQERNEAILHILLKNGASVNGKDIDERTPILWAASNGNTEAMMSLIQAGGDRYAIDRDQLNALHCAASHGHEHMLELLIESCDKSIIDATDRNGDTPLFYAVTLGHFECARLLLLSGANANHQDLRLRTPSHCAAAKGQLRMLKVLKHFGASFEIQNRRGDIPLHEAIQAGSKDIVEWLLALHPSTINSANHEGRTGLHLAAASGNMEIVVMLCSKNAEIDPVMFYKGALYTPLDFAKKKGHELVVEYLTRRHSAKTANQIPEDQRKDWMRKLEEQIEQGKSLTSSRRLGVNLSTTMWWENFSAIILFHNKLSGSRRPSSASPRALSSFVPKSTSTTDLLNVFDNMAVGDTQAEREAVDERIKRIVQEQIQKAVHANEEEDLLKKDIEEADTSVTQSATEVDSIIAYAAQENSESKKKNKKSIRATSTKSKTKSRRRGDSEAKENVSPSRNVSKKSTKPQTPEASDEEDEPIASPAEHFDDNSDSPYGNVRQDNENNGSIDVVYSSAEDTGADSIAFEEFRAKARRALRDTSSSGVVAHRDIFDDNVRRAPKEKPKEKKTNLRYLHEKAIFNELTHLKKMQIQYGKVNERVLVRSLIGNFCKMHDLNPAHFKFQTFYAWEKFLYDQLKLIYMEERQRLKNTRPPPNTRFESRLRQARAIPINMRGSELMRLSDEQSSSAKSTRKSVNSRGTDKQSYTGHRRCDCLGNHVLIK